ncbi:WecB/TagA/CpsF family glycosyltransferase [Microvirga sp. BT688]|nr:WecB/TagA/CpsF family glycosyltransferase [Microvirga sp.]
MSNAVTTSRTLGKTISDDTALNWLSNAHVPEIVQDVTSDDGVSCDDLDREVYCLQGFPIDSIGMQEVMPRLLAAMVPHSSYLLSTPNLNFLAASQSDAGFRESLRTSDLCPPDGIALVWIARLLGIPIKERVAGSDIFEAFVTREKLQRPIRVFLFGGAEGVAAMAAEVLNKNATGVICVGWINPGFGSVEEMSHSHIINAINASGADLLLVALGAAKGQAWLQRNHHIIQVPVRSHLGATIAFVAGTIKRAPTTVRKLGLEWLWRIKEEPVLWRRYTKDVSALSALMVTRVLPLAFVSLLARAKRAVKQRKCRTMVTSTAKEAKVSLLGSVSASDVPALRATFKQVIKRTDHLNVDLSGLNDIDARALGLLMMLRKQMISKYGSFKLSNPPVFIRILFRLHGIGDLLKHTTDLESHHSQGSVRLLKTDLSIQTNV